MASTTALFTGLSGVSSHAKLLDIVGNNIANVNTTGFKANRAQFAPTFSRTASLGTAPSDVSGGANPAQIGLGVNLQGTQRDFSGGALSVTGRNTNLAIDGDGLFILDVAGETRYTRDGNFALNSEHDLVTVTGGHVLGYGVDDNFNIQSGSTIGNIVVPIGSLTVAEATRNVRFRGNLNAGGDVGAGGAQIALAALEVLPSGTPPSNPPFADASTFLVELDGGSGSAMFSDGDQLMLSGVEKGGRILGDSTFDITGTTTVSDYMDFMVSALGIDTSDATTPGGATLDDTTGVVTIEGNFGTANEIDIETADSVRLDSSGTQLGQPFVYTKMQEATGESVRTTFRAYDSIGNGVDIDLTMVLSAKADTGTTWEYFVDSSDNVGDGLSVGSGTIAFDTTGRIIPPGAFTVQVSRENTGASDPLSITIDLDEQGDIVTALSSVKSEIAATFQDGSSIGTLTDFAVEDDGTITGAFTNGLLRTVGQVVMATFTNKEGLVDLGNLQYAEGPNSGEALITTPLSNGGGRVVSGSLELSNVDLSNEFINLILASTGYTASSRVINTANQLFQQLLSIGR